MPDNDAPEDPLDNYKKQHKELIGLATLMWQYQQGTSPNAWLPNSDRTARVTVRYESVWPSECSVHLDTGAIEWLNAPRLGTPTPPASFLIVQMRITLTELFTDRERALEDLLRIERAKLQIEDALTALAL